jgi:gliding motility-associated lipoprotein GldD
MKFLSVPGKWLLPALLPAALLISCHNDYTPKPRGYFRIDFPDHAYRKFDSTAFPYAFEYPVYAVIAADPTPGAEPYWINVKYPQFNAQVHLSYKPVKGNLAQYLEDAHTLVNKHIQKASAITQREYADPGHGVYGLSYAIEGSEAASPYQFYLTDSTRNFVRGALYFDLVPNNDSLMPVITFLRDDIDRMISTFRWKNPR